MFNGITPARKQQGILELEAIRLAQTGDKPITEVARALGIGVNQIYKWKNQSAEKQDSAFPGQGQQLGKDAELTRLKHENQRLREENEILKKAAAYFAKELQ